MLSPAAAAFLRSARAGRLATADASGAPHAVPVCYAFDEEAAVLYIPIDAKPKGGDPRRLRRLRNLGENPRAALLVDRYEEEWEELGFVLVRGAVRVLSEGPERKEALSLLEAKYPQYRAMGLAGLGLPVIALTVERTAEWGKLG